MFTSHVAAESCFITGVHAWGLVAALACSIRIGLSAALSGICNAVGNCIAGLGTPGMTASLSYFDSIRRARLPANLVQAQRDFFGSHTYERTDKDGWFHTVWDPRNSAESITSAQYNT